MRGKRRMIIGTVVAILALGAVGVASALATPQFYVNGKPLVGTEAVTASSRTPYKFNNASWGVTITCQVKATGTIESQGQGKATDTFTKCTTEINGSNCKVSEPITLKGKTKLEYSESEKALYNVLEPEAGSSGLGEFEFTGACALPKEVLVTGKTCSLVRSEAEALLQYFQFATTNAACRKLGFDYIRTTLSGEEQAELTSKKIWSARKA